MMKRAHLVAPALVAALTVGTISLASGPASASGSSNGSDHCGDLALINNTHEDFSHVSGNGYLDSALSSGLKAQADRSLGISCSASTVTLDLAGRGSFTLSTDGATWSSAYTPRAGASGYVIVKSIRAGSNGFIVDFDPPK